MTTPLDPFVGLGLRIFDAIKQRGEKDPAKKAAVAAARSRLLGESANELEDQAKVHELASLTGDTQSRRFHLRRARKLFRKRDRLRSRSLWWGLRAARWGIEK